MATADRFIKKLSFSAYALEQPEVNYMFSRYDAYIHECLVFLFRNNYSFLLRMINILITSYVTKTKSQLVTYDDSITRAKYFTFIVYANSKGVKEVEFFNRLKELDFYRRHLVSILDAYDSTMKSLVSTSNELALAHMEFIVNPSDLLVVDNYFTCLKKYNEALEFAKSYYVDCDTSFGTFAEFSAMYERASNAIEAIETPFYRKIFAKSLKSVDTRDVDLVSDCFQEGYNGLRRASGTYSVKKNAIFSSYIDFWISQALYARIGDSALIRLPANIQQLSKKISNAKQKCSDVDQLCSELKMTEDRIKDIEEISSISCTTRIEYMTEADEEREGLTYEMFEDNDDSVKSQILEYLDVLTPIETKLVCLSYGLFEYLPETPIDSEFISRERARQLS